MPDRYRRYPPETDAWLIVLAAVIVTGAVLYVVFRVL